MKKILILMAIVILSVSVANADRAVTLPMGPNEYNQPVKTLEENLLEQKLDLTKKQKAKARKINLATYKKTKPIMKKIEEKKQEAKMVKMSKIAIRDQKARLAVIDKEIENLEKQIKEIKAQNNKKFQSILTKKQKEILKETQNN